MLPGEQYIDQDSERIDIRSAVCLGESILFRRGVSQGAENACVTACCFVQRSGADRIEVNQDTPVTVQDHIFRLHIPVDQSTGVEHIKRITDIQRDPAHLVLIQCAAQAEFRQVVARDKLLQHNHMT